MKIIEDASGDLSDFRTNPVVGCIFGKRFRAFVGQPVREINVVDEKRRTLIDDGKIADGGPLNMIAIEGKLPRPGWASGAGGLKRSIRFLQQ